MTAITSNATRQPLDYYATPSWMVQELLNHHPINGSIFEPCAGESLAIARYLKSCGYQDVKTSDIDLKVKSDYHGDASNKSKWPYLPSADWIITNPPFSAADEILPLAYENARVGVAFLLRCTYMESLITGDRANWLEAHPPCQIISVPRFAFSRSPKTGKWQTDSAPCWWHIWRKDGLKPASPIVVVPWHKIKNFQRIPESIAISTIT